MSQIRGWAPWPLSQDLWDTSKELSKATQTSPWSFFLPHPLLVQPPCPWTGVLQAFPHWESSSQGCWWLGGQVLTLAPSWPRMFPLHYSGPSGLLSGPLSPPPSSEAPRSLLGQLGGAVGSGCSSEPSQRACVTEGRVQGPGTPGRSLWGWRSCISAPPGE